MMGGGLCGQIGLGWGGFVWNSMLEDLGLRLVSLGGRGRVGRRSQLFQQGGGFRFDHLRISRVRFHQFAQLIHERRFGCLA